jgi:hypothetical protein
MSPVKRRNAAFASLELTTANGLRIASVRYCYSRWSGVNAARAAVHIQTSRPILVEDAPRKTKQAIK